MYSIRIPLQINRKMLYMSLPGLFLKVEMLKMNHFNKDYLPFNH